MSEQDGQENEITFTDAQQAFIDKRIGQARIKAREKAETDAKAAQALATSQAEEERMATEKEWQKLASHHEARVLELEPLEAQVTQFVALIDGMLKDRVKALGDAAKKAVGALPESLSLVEKLNWLNANEALFVESSVVKNLGTPVKGQKRKASGSGTPEELGHQRLRI